MAKCPWVYKAWIDGYSLYIIQSLESRFPLTPTSMPGTRWENTQIQPRDLPRDFLQRVITHGVYAQVSQPSTRKVQGDEVNHWRLFFAISEKESISLDMVKHGADNPKGNLGVLGRNYPVSNTGVLSIPMIQAPGLTVTTVLDIIQSNGLLRYQYTPAGEGCRYWIKRVVDLLKFHRLLFDADSRFPQFDECIDFLWRPGPYLGARPVAIQKEIEQGSIY